MNWEMHVKMELGTGTVMANTIIAKLDKKEQFIVDSAKVR